MGNTSQKTTLCKYRDHRLLASSCCAVLPVPSLGGLAVGRRGGLHEALLGLVHEGGGGGEGGVVGGLEAGVTVPVGKA